MNPIALYLRLVQIALKSRLQYRADFVTGVIGVLVMNVVTLGLIGILVTRFSDLNGWTVWEVVFLYSLWILGHSLYSMFLWHMRTLEDYLVQGTFDQFLLRPVSPFVMFLGREVQYLGIADFAIGASGVSLAYVNLGLHWDVGQWAFLLVAILCGALIETTISLMIACIAFWTGRSRRANQLVMQVNVMVQYYPVDIFGTIFRVIVTGLIPVAFMNYYPALMLLGKLDRVGDWWFLAYMSPVVVAILIVLASGVWRLALRQYSSSGG